MEGVFVLTAFVTGFALGILGGFWLRRNST